MNQPVHPALGNLLTPEYLRTSQIIYGAMVMSVLSFLTVTVLIYSQSQPNPDGDESLLQTLSLVHAVSALGSYSVALFLYTTRPKAPGNSTESTEQKVEDLLRMLRSTQIVCLALFEGVAFLGLVVCMIGSMSGVLHFQPVYWWNALSAAALLGFVILTFPNEERVVSIVSEKLGW